MARLAYTNDAKGRVLDHGKPISLAKARKDLAGHIAGSAMLDRPSTARVSAELARQLARCLEVAERANAARRSRKHLIKQEAA